MVFDERESGGGDVGDFVWIPWWLSISADMGR